MSLEFFGFPINAKSVPDCEQRDRPAPTEIDQRLLLVREACRKGFLSGWVFVAPARPLVMQTVNLAPVVEGDKDEE